MLPRLFCSGISYLIFSKSILFYQILFLIYEAYLNDVMLSLYHRMNVTGAKEEKERDIRILNLLSFISYAHSYLCSI